MPALPPYIVEPIWEQFRALLPEHKTNHPLGCHRRRIPERIVFEKLVQILVFGCAYWRIADASCSESTLCRRRDEWIELGVMERLRRICLDTYKRLVCLELSEVAVEGWLTKAPCGGQKAGRALDFWVAFSEVVILVSRLIQEGWVRYRWEGRSSRKL